MVTDGLPPLSGKIHQDSIGGNNPFQDYLYKKIRGVSIGCKKFKISGSLKTTSAEKTSRAQPGGDRLGGYDGETGVMIGDFVLI